MPGRTLQPRPSLRLGGSTAFDLAGDAVAVADSRRGSEC
jgi:hypothetical protein